ncbi:MAG: ABC transporter substrate-binding protein [Anaerolineae bacterium]
MCKRIRRGLGTALVVLGAASLAACQSQPKTVTVTITRVVPETIVSVQTVEVMVAAEADPSPTPLPSPKDLVICMQQEPVSLFRYGRTLPAETAVLHALYENDATHLDYGYQPQGLVKIPSLADGDARLQSVTVQAGEPVVAANGQLVTLQKGVAVNTAEGVTAIYDGAPIVMEQLVVEFSMKKRVWADGTAVTAADSVYSFRLASHPAIPADKFKTDRTASYEAIGVRQVRWTGLPGFRDASYFTNFWPPVPRHLWENIPPESLPTNELAAHMPVGDGPFRMAAWEPGSFIRLEPNEFYYRQEEGLPRLNSVTFRFNPDKQALVDSLLRGECDIIPQDSVDISQAPFFLVAEADGLLTTHFQTGTVFEHIAFGVDSWRYYGDGDNRPDWFEDVRVRQAMNQCTDRQRMVDEVMYGRSQVVHAFVPDNHPLFPDNAILWPYDPVAANRLLDEVGFVDKDGDGIREDPQSGLDFEVSLGTPTTNVTEQQLAKIFQDNMRDCGIDVKLTYLPANQWLADGPDSPLFGRRFDLGQFAWTTADTPYCQLFASWEITGPREEINRETDHPYAGWNGLNETGWWNPTYDRACQTAMATLPGTPEYTASHEEAIALFTQNVPAIPLFLRLKLALAQPDVVNFQPNPTMSSDLWNLFEMDMQQDEKSQLAE